MSEAFVPDFTCASLLYRPLALAVFPFLLIKAGSELGLTWTTTKRAIVRITTMTNIVTIIILVGAKKDLTSRMIENIITKMRGDIAKKAERCVIGLGSSLPDPRLLPSCTHCDEGRRLRLASSPTDTSPKKLRALPHWPVGNVAPGILRWTNQMSKICQQVSFELVRMLLSC